MKTQGEKNEQTSIGRVEAVLLPNGRLVVAKVDTGAYSSSVHCDHMEEREENGATALYFSLNHGGQWLKAEQYEKIAVRVANGHQTERYAVPLTINIGAAAFTTLFTLNPRYDMKCEMLLGRRFLQENNLLVDVMQDYLLCRQRKER